MVETTPQDPSRAQFLENLRFQGVISVSIGTGLGVGTAVHELIFPEHEIHDKLNKQVHNTQSKLHTLEAANEIYALHGLDPLQGQTKADELRSEIQTLYNQYPESYSKSLDAYASFTAGLAVCALSLYTLGRMIPRSRHLKKMNQHNKPA